MTETRANRREVIGVALAGGLAALGGTTAFAAEPGVLSDAEFKKLAAAPKTAADHRALAKHYRAMEAAHQAEAKMYDGLAVQYAKGVPVASTGQAHELGRAMKHAAEHSRDFAEAMGDVAEVHEGIAQGPL